MAPPEHAARARAQLTLALSRLQLLYRKHKGLCCVLGWLRVVCGGGASGT